MIENPTQVSAKSLRKSSGASGAGKRKGQAVKAPHINEEVACELVQLFKLFADETRLRILTYLLHKEELNVRAMCQLLGQSQPAVSHHLALLRVAGLIQSRRDGKHNFYHLVPDRFEEMTEMAFSLMPNAARRVRFNHSILSLLPVETQEEVDAVISGE